VPDRESENGMQFHNGTPEAGQKSHAKDRRADFKLGHYRKCWSLASTGDSVSIGRIFQRGRYGLNQGKEEGRLRLALFLCVEITMPKGPFLPSDFTATKFSIAADKAEFGNTFLHFIESEWARTAFSKSFYNRLSMCFGHIAHYCRSQFYEEWFSSLGAQVRFLKHTLRFPCYGDPEYTFSDVERAIQREIGIRNCLARYELRLAEEQQATDLALLRQLESKYRTPAGERDQEPQLSAPPVDQTPITPVQGSLF
jgi:hypothetical protein